MVARQGPLLIGAGAAVVAIIAAVVIVRGSSPASGATEPAPTASATSAVTAASAVPSASAAPSASAVPSASAAPEAGAASAPVVEVDEASDGKTVDLAPGQQLRATLDANPTTGFDWAVTKAPPALGAPVMGYVPGGSAPGAPGKRHLTWTLKTALPAGEHAVELGYARSFEKGVPPFKTFRIKVRAAH